VREIIERVRAAVDRAIDSLIEGLKPVPGRRRSKAQPARKMNRRYPRPCRRNLVNNSEASHHAKSKRSPCRSKVSSAHKVEANLSRAAKPEGRSNIYEASPPPGCSATGAAYLPESNDGFNPQSERRRARFPAFPNVPGTIPTRQFVSVKAVS